MFTVTTFEPGQEVKVYTDLSASDFADMVEDLNDLGIKYTFEKQAK